MRLDIGVDVCPVTQVYQTKNVLITPSATSKFVIVRSRSYAPSLRGFRFDTPMRQGKHCLFCPNSNIRSMHIARSFFIAYFNQNHHSNQSTKQRRLGVDPTSLGWKKGTKARCLDVAGNCFGEKYYKFFCELLILTFMHICAYGQMSLRGNNEATFLYKDVVLNTVSFGAVEFSKPHKCSNGVILFFHHS